MPKAVGFSQKTFDTICDRLVSGESLRSICRDKAMPSTTTVFKWLAERPDTAEQYARARETQADAIVDEIVEIADTEDDSAKARVRIDARKWVAGKMRPKKYGDKLLNEHSGPDGGPIQTEDVTPGDRLREFLDAKSSRPPGGD